MGSGKAGAQILTPSLLRLGDLVQKSLRSSVHQVFFDLLNRDANSSQNDNANRASGTVLMRSQHTLNDSDYLC